LIERQKKRLNKGPKLKQTLTPERGVTGWTDSYFFSMLVLMD